jgi:hypothetical protein
MTQKNGAIFIEESLANQPKDCPVLAWIDWREMRREPAAAKHC